MCSQSLVNVTNQVFNTSPCIFHHPGRNDLTSLNDIANIIKLKTDLFRMLSAGNDLDFFIDRKEGIRLPIPLSTFRREECQELGSLLTVILVSNLDELGSMARVLDYYGIKYVVLGRKIKKWQNIIKIDLLCDFLPSVKTPFVSFFDCDDVFITDHLSTALEYFRGQSQCKMLMMGGEVLWPPEFLDPAYSDCISFIENKGQQYGSRHCYPNSGGWIGRTDFCRYFFRMLQGTNFSPFPLDDQPRFWLLYPDFYPDLKIDYRCNIFQCEFASEISYNI